MPEKNTLDSFGKIQNFQWQRKLGKEMVMDWTHSRKQTETSSKTCSPGTHRERDKEADQEIVELTKYIAC